MKKIDIIEEIILTDGNPRKLRVLLPDHYDPKHKKYPVIYMHDGQNLFEDQTSYAGYSWRIYETLKTLNLSDQFIVVGIDNSDLRLFEYSPWKSGEKATQYIGIETGGLGSIYADFVAGQVKPLIDQTYATLSDAKHTYMLGSSMGAYISIYIALTHPNVFSAIGSFSIASWYNEKALLDFIETYDGPTDMKFYISVGSKESSDETMAQAYIENSQALKKYLETKGFRDIPLILTDDTHHESAWEKQFKSFMLWLKKDA